VGAHEYVVFFQQRDLFLALQERLRQPDAWTASYNGSRQRYVELGGYRYWIVWPAANRERVRANLSRCGGCHRRHER
jgi:hypothetical protein